jgi:pimeloyl-ACP methyl ester carboxylesterase
MALPIVLVPGLSMGGYVAFEIVRQAPERVARLALLSTSARLDPPQITERRRRQIALARIACPTLVVVGDGDELIAPESSVEIADGIPGARLVTIADCGHLSTLERPAQVTAALTEWLQA